MDRSGIVASLTEITGTWSTGRGVASADLSEARTILASALASGARSEDLSTPGAGRVRLAAGVQGREAIETLVGRLRPAPAPDVRPFIRSAVDLDPSSRANIAGMKVAKTLGPFIDQLGIEHFVDLIPLPKKIPIESSSGVLALLIIDAPTVHPSPPQQNVQLGAGSLWISVSALVGGTGTGFVGLAFSKAVEELVNVQSAPDGGLLLKPGSKLTLELTLAPETPPAPTSPIGRDAANMALNLPAHATIVFQSSGATVSAFDDSSATVYGSTFTLKRKAVQPQVVNLGLSFLTLPCDLLNIRFAVTACVSTDFVLSGATPVTWGGWAIPIATASASALGSAVGAGALALQAGSGISAVFGDLTSPNALNDVALILQPKRIGIVAHTGTRETHDRLLLWGPPPPAPPQAFPPPIRRVSEVDLTYARGARVFAIIVPGTETVVAFCTVAANLDRPLAADGSRLPLAYNAGVAGFIDASNGKFAIVLALGPP